MEPCCPPPDRPTDARDHTGDVTRMFKALGDPVRLQMLTLIARHPEGEVCVCDIAAGFDLTQPTVSHHLKVLRDAGLLDCARRGTWVYYWMVPASVHTLSAVLTDLTPRGAAA